jgi:hypothetical protein
MGKVQRASRIERELDGKSRRKLTSRGVVNMSGDDRDVVDLYRVRHMIRRGIMTVPEARAAMGVDAKEFDKRITPL